MWYEQSLANSDRIALEDDSLAVDGNQAAFVTRITSYRRCYMRSLIPWRRKGEVQPVERRMENRMQDFFDDFDRFWDRSLMPWERERSLWQPEAWGPALESHIENGNLIVKADLPGIDPKDVSISVTGNQLTIEGERKHEKKEEEKGYHYREFTYGKFARTMTLPEGVEADKVKATYKDGVLRMTMPAPKEMTPKRIQIEAK
jgi:HSP20 family protein